MDPSPPKDRLYHVARDGILYALSMEGKILWKFVKQYPFGSPTISEGKIYVGSEDHNMYCLDMDGKELPQPTGLMKAEELGELQEAMYSWLIGSFWEAILVGRRQAQAPPSSEQSD